MSPPIFDTVRNLLQINARLLQYSRRFVSSRNPYQTRFELWFFVITYGPNKSNCDETVLNLVKLLDYVLVLCYIRLKMGNIYKNK